MSIEEEFDRNYKELPKQVRLGFALFIETYPGTYQESMQLLDVLYRMQTRFNAWKKHRVVDLGFQMRKHKREYSSDEHNGYLSLEDELELLQDNHVAKIQERERELALLYTGITMLMESGLESMDVALRLKNLVKNLHGPRTIENRSPKYIKKDETIAQQIAKA